VALVDELLQPLLQRMGICSGASAGQPRGDRLDRLALAVQQQPAQVGLAWSRWLVLAGMGSKMGSAKAARRVTKYC
jgi:hypothetical protein